MMKQPYSLQYQCITRLQRIILGLFIKEMNLPGTLPYTWLREQIICIPHNLVNEAVRRLLFVIDQIPFDPYYYEEYPGQLAFLYTLTATILHPNVTELLVQPPNMNKNGSLLEWNYIIPFVCKHLFTLSKLKVIRLPACKCTLTPDLGEGRLPQLENFTYYGDCTDELLECVIRSSISLKQVDVQNSEHVTDKSIDSILKLHNLQHLNIGRTGLTTEGLNKLLNSDILQQLKFLGISVTSSQPFVENFARMTQLRGLSFYKSNLFKVDEVEQVVENLGKQLVYLSVPLENSTIMDVVKEQCTTLKIFYIVDDEDMSYYIIAQSS